MCRDVSKRPNRSRKKSSGAAHRAAERGCRESIFGLARLQVVELHRGGSRLRFRPADLQPRDKHPDQGHNITLTVEN